MRLIDADELEELFNKQIESGATDLFNALDDALQDAQTVDAVPVVRCNDCIYATIFDGSDVLYCTSSDGLHSYVADDDYCSEGERIYDEQQI